MTPRALRQRQVGSLSRPVNVQIGFKGTHRRASCTHGTGWSMASGPENHTPISPSVSPAKAHRRSRTHRAPRLRSRKLRLAADVLWRADVPAAAGVSVRAARWLMASTQAVGARDGERRQVGTTNLCVQRRIVHYGPKICTARTNGPPTSRCVLASTPPAVTALGQRGFAAATRDSHGRMADSRLQQLAERRAQ